MCSGEFDVKVCLEVIYELKLLMLSELELTRGNDEGRAVI